MTADTPVLILQHQAEFAELLHLYRQHAPMRTLEVGTYHGGTLYHWLQNAPPNAIVVSIDTYNAGVDNRHLYAQWTPLGVELVVIHGDSQDQTTIARAAEHGPYDWLFIDADHRYHQVKADWNNYRPLMAPGGTVAFHDILTHPNHPEIGVGQLWAELTPDHQHLEIVDDRDATWGGIGVITIPLDDAVNSIPDRDVGNPANERPPMTETVEEPTEPAPDPEPDDEDEGA